MKQATQNIIQRLSLFLLVLVLTMPAWAQSGNESYYAIANKEDWKKFCDLVENGQHYLNAKLTADVDLGTEVVRLGNSIEQYTGTFDGQGYTLTFDWTVQGGGAPFDYVGNGTIKNLRTKGKLTTNGSGASGLLGNASGTTTISNCVSDVQITCSFDNACKAAGLIQYIIYGAHVTITDCVVKGSITATTEEAKKGMAGFVYEKDGDCTLTRCLYVGTNNATDNEGSYTFAPTGATLTDCYFRYRCGEGQGEYVDEVQLKSGEVAHKLQGSLTEQVWGQTLGTDNEPQLDATAAKHVYKVDFTYNGDVVTSGYANSGQPIHGDLPSFYLPGLLGEGYNEHHYYELAFGDGFTNATPIDADRTVTLTFIDNEYFTIAGKEDWKKFCDIVKDGQNAIDVKMTANVDLGTDIVMVGDWRNKYSGTFDGQGHTLSFDWDAGEDSNIALFQYLSGTLQNLRTKGKITSKGRYLSGLVVNAYSDTKISHCVSDVDIIGGSDGNASSAAGLIQEIGRNSAQVTITDCVVKGSINDRSNVTSYVMSGFVYGMRGDCTLTNCLYLGTSNATDDKGNNTFAPAGATLENCYYLYPCGTAQGDKISKEQLKSGYVTNKLQAGRADNVWGQTLGTDNEPQLDATAAKHVYKVDFTYNGKTVSRYANSGQTVSLPKAKEFVGADYSPLNTYTLTFSDNFDANTAITADKTVTVSMTIVTKDYFAIASKDDWREYYDLVLNGQPYDAKMTADVDLGKDVLIIGTTYSQYSKTFDGQGHTLTIDWTVDQYDQGQLFTFLGDGAAIKNLRIKGKITSDNVPIAGIASVTEGNVTISNCVNELDLISNNNRSHSLSGMIRLINNGKVTFNNCVVKGRLDATTDEGKKEMGGFVGQQDGTCEVNNCLYVGTNNAGEGSYTFANGANVNNCYYLHPCGEKQGTQAIEKELRNGVMTAKLQNNRTDAAHWAQVLGDMPNPYFDVDKSKTNYVYYNATDSRWACENFVLTDGKILPIGIDFIAIKATYERPFTNLRSATICLPYEQSVEGLKVYGIAGGNGTKAIFEPVSGKLEAYKPYYIKVGDTTTLGGENLQVKAYTDANLITGANGYTLTGTVDGIDNATAAAANAYILQSDGMFHRVTTVYTDATIPPYRAYIVCPKQIVTEKISVVLNDETTDIDGVTDDATDISAAVYDLQGRHVADSLDATTRHQLPAGVYIVGGRKVIVK